jgi:hypothetical protein
MKPTAARLLPLRSRWCAEGRPFAGSRTSGSWPARTAAASTPRGYPPKSTDQTAREASRRGGSCPASRILAPLAQSGGGGREGNSQRGEALGPRRRSPRGPPSVRSDLRSLARRRGSRELPEGEAAAAARLPGLEPRAAAVVPRPARGAAAPRSGREKRPAIKRRALTRRDSRSGNRSMQWV